MHPKVQDVLKKIERFLVFRPRTEKEIRDKVRRIPVQGDVVDELIELLKGNGYLNDTAFGYDWAESRIRSKMIGRGKLRAELRIKGIPDSVIEEILDHIYSENNETELALALVNKKFKRGVVKEDLPGIRPLLVRNGYSFQIADTVIRILKDQSDNQGYEGDENGIEDHR
ncbi:MAG: hypothetical protein A2Y33_08490 [Spirochaetes bacterium GWF1_51_8]|nr:MAG: hypothetical protein A2Y33_08490 [Spirochaetes bacterium GWF1_51_8]